jgi:hypothetical protein
MAEVYLGVDVEGSSAGKVERITFRFRIGVSTLWFHYDSPALHSAADWDRIAAGPATLTYPGLNGDTSVSSDGTTVRFLVVKDNESRVEFALPAKGCREVFASVGQRIRGLGRPSGKDESSSAAEHHTS